MYRLSNLNRLAGVVARARRVHRASRTLSSSVLLAFCFFVQQSLTAATTCEELLRTSLPGGAITSAQTVAAGAFNPRAEGGGFGGGPAPNYSALPAFCRLQASLRPSPDSDIQIELWMPASSEWNGKFFGVGNGGLGGGAEVSPVGLANALRMGYAASGNNTGHAGDSRYALDHPEKIKDFGYRSVHEMTVAAKALIREYYGRSPNLSYTAGGGGGATAALSSSQRYPDDYDSVAVNGMSSYFTRQTFGQMWIWQATHKDNASYIPAAKYSTLHKAALDSCDAKDGLKDGIIGDPEGCHFDPSVTRCKGPDGPDCLTAPQVEAAKKIYSGPHNSRTGDEVYSPLYPGSEMGWGPLAGGDEPFPVPVEFFKYFVFRDPKWDYKTRPVNFDDDLQLADRPENSPMNSIAPDLGPFFSRGGKFLLVDGWSDNLIPPKIAINYYHAVVAKVGPKKAAESMRFFMVPGMQHGPGTAGAENFYFDNLSLLTAWKEDGKAPDRLVVKHYKDGVQIGTRLVCQYPKIARYRGTGNTEDFSSYVCKRP